MDEMTSSEFRRRYASLKSPTLVTVNGRPIGEWRPHIFSAAEAEDNAYLASVQAIEEVKRLKRELATRPLPHLTGVGPAFNTKPFRPVPK